MVYFLICLFVFLTFPPLIQLIIDKKVARDQKDFNERQEELKELHATQDLDKF